MDVAASQLVQTALAKIAQAELALFKAGKVLEAVVVKSAADGAATLRIGDLLVAAQAPEPLPQGATVQLLVKSGGAVPQLTLMRPASAEASAPVVIAPLPELPVQVLPLPPAPPKAQPAQTLAPATSQTESSAPANPSASVSGAPAVQARMPVEAPAPNAQPTTVPPTALAAPPQSPMATPPSPSSDSRPALTQPPSAAPQQTVPTTTSVAQPSPMPAPIPHGSSSVSVSPEPGPQTNAIPAAPLETVPGSPRPAPPVQPGPADPQRPVSGPVPQPASAATTLPSAPTPTEARPAQPSVSSLTPSAPIVAPEPEPASPLGSLLVAQAAPRPPTTMADLPKPQSSPPTPTPNSAPPTPATPAAAQAQAMPDALSKQDSLGPLLHSLATAMTRPGALPEPVLRAALQILGQRIAVADGRVSGQQIEQAVARSGVYLEALLARGATVPGDLKSSLLGLKATLEKWLGGPPAPTVPQDRAPPPLRDLPPRAGAAELPPLPDTPRDAARLLHGQADAALSRTKLLQMASLPDISAPKEHPLLRVELPFLIGHELAMAQIEFARDRGGRKAARQRGWTVRFAMNMASTGEVGAEIGLLGTAVTVGLWAAEPQTAEALREALPELAGALEASGLQPGSIRVRGAAPAPEKVPSGQLLDSVS